MRWLLHFRFTLFTRLALGLVFIAAALSKIADPPAFAKSLWAYQLFPPWSLHPLALALPWLELITGVALCLGLWIRAAAAWATIMVIGFGLALSINLARHNPVDCGCFGSGKPKTEAERLMDMKWALARDAGLLLLALQILAANRFTTETRSTPRKSQRIEH